MKQKIFQILIISITCYGCQENQTTEKPTFSPEEVIQRYQKHIDNNEFASAILLSTAEGAELIQEVAASLSVEELEMSKLTTKFNSINCQIEEDVAICICEMEDEYEKYEAEFVLILDEGEWLVDAPESGQDQQEINEIVDDVLENLRN